MTTASISTIVVGIDIGMTCTGVAYAEYTPGGGTPNVEHIQEWPPKSSEYINKVPTVIAYRDGKVTKKWGLECAWGASDYDPTFTRKDYFKPLLDEDGPFRALAFEEASRRPKSDQIEEWYLIFLSELYDWIQRTFTAKYTEYSRDQRNPTLRHNVRYVFSVPTTWGARTVHRMERIIHKAGFGRIDGHSAKIGPTEAEAAAIWAMLNAPPSAVIGSDYEEGGKQHFEKDDTLIVCDAGGCTTDVTTLRIISREKEEWIMSQLCQVDGSWIGSVEIDRLVEKLINDELERARKLRTRSNPVAGDTHKDPKYSEDTLAQTSAENEILKFGQREVALAVGRFQDIKHRVGEPIFDLLKYFKVLLLKNGPTILDTSIEDGFLVIEVEKLHQIFDELIEGIERLIESQLHSVQAERGRVYLVLSGGLGSSKYVQDKLAKRFRHVNVLRTNDRSNLQMAVSRGIVLQELYKLANRKCMIVRKSRASYGVLFDHPIPKNAKKKLLHDGERPECYINPLDGELYIRNKIIWLMTENDEIQDWGGDNYISYSTKRSLPYSREHDIIEWKETIVQHRESGGNAPRPQYFRDGKGAEQVLEVACKVEAMLSFMKNGKLRKKRKWLLLGPKYWVLSYELRIFVKPADVQVEIFVNGKPVARDGFEVDFSPNFVHNDE